MYSARNRLVASLVSAIALTNLSVALGQSIIRVAQESQPGLGDFDANVLGNVRAYRAAQSPAEIYAYSTSNDSYNGTLFPMLSDNRSHLFVAQTTSSIAIFVINDGGPGNSDAGGSARTFIVCYPNRDAFGRVRDDPDDGCWCSWNATNPSRRINSLHQSWSRNHTDGLVIAGLHGHWSARVDFRDTLSNCEDGDPCGVPSNPVAFEGLDEWVAYSSDDVHLELVLEANRRIELRPLLDVSQPAPSSLVVCERLPLELSVETEGAPTVLWRRNDVVLENSPGIQITTTSDTSTLLITPAQPGTYDVLVVNQHGTVQSNPSIIGTCPSCSTDLDCNCTTDLQDLAILLSHFGSDGSFDEGDTDGDGDIDLQDLANLLARFGNACA